MVEHEVLVTLFKYLVGSLNNEAQIDKCVNQLQTNYVKTIFIENSKKPKQTYSR